MTIKNWVKTRDNEWEHKTARIGKGYDQRGNLFKHHSVNIRYMPPWGYIVPGTETSKPFSSKAAATKHAVAYMKSHPRG